MLFLSNESKNHIQMNAGTFNEQPFKNIVPEWLLPSTCLYQKCHYNAQFKPNKLCVKGIPYQHNTSRKIYLQQYKFSVNSH